MCLHGTTCLNVAMCTLVNMQVEDHGWMYVGRHSIGSAPCQKATSTSALARIKIDHELE